MSWDDAARGAGAGAWGLGFTVWKDLMDLRSPRLRSEK